MITPTGLMVVWSALILLSVSGTLFFLCTAVQFTDNEMRAARLSVVMAGVGVLYWTEFIIRSVFTSTLPLEGWLLPFVIVSLAVGVFAIVPIIYLLYRNSVHRMTRVIVIMNILAWAASSGVALVAFVWI